MKTTKDPSVIFQVKRAFKSGNRLATFVGLLLGGFVPLAIYTISHAQGFTFDVVHSGAARVPVTLVLGGLCYSAQTVYKWATMAFVNALKSLGFVVLLEGILCTTSIHWLSVMALCYLVAINSIATGCNLSLGVRK